MNFVELVKSFIFAHGLITYHDGNSRLMDIDSITQKLGYFIIIETKTFYMDEIEIKLAAFCLLHELYNQLSRREIYIVATDSNDLIEPDDSIWWINFDCIRKLDNADDRKHVHVHRGQMHKTTRREFNFYTVLFSISRTMGMISQMVWERALGIPITRPKSVTTDWIRNTV